MTFKKNKNMTFHISIIYFLIVESCKGFVRVIVDERTPARCHEIQKTFPTQVCLLRMFTSRCRREAKRRTLCFATNYNELMVDPGEGRSPMTSLDAEMDFKPIVIIIRGQGEVVFFFLFLSENKEKNKKREASPFGR